MRVAFDLHGVLETNTDFFKKILNYLNDIEVHITVLSGPPTEQIISELESLGYTPWYKYFSQILSVVDYLRFESDANMWQDERGNWWTDEPTWWASKGKICEKYKIDVIIDDKIQYFESFAKNHPTKFILLNKENAKEIENLINKTLLPS
jgi:hypothetical protein